MTDNGIHLMDGIEGLRSLPRGSVDMLLTDLSYGTTRNYWDVPLPLPELLEAVEWAVKPTGAILLFAQCPYDKVLGASNLAMLRYEWVWYKDRGTGFLNARRMPLKKSENILVFYRHLPTYNPQYEYREPYFRAYSSERYSSNYGITPDHIQNRPTVNAFPATSSNSQRSIKASIRRKSRWSFANI